MILELLIVFEILAFILFALGLIPFNRGKDGSLPLVNKAIFIILASIMFFSLAILAVSFDKVHCYEDTELVDGNLTTYTSICDHHKIESMSVSYLNYGMGIISLMVGVIIIILAALTKDDHKYSDEE